MADKAVQVAIGSKWPRKAPAICETIPEVPKGKVEQGTQCGISETGSHDRNTQHKRWLMEEGLMAKERLCPMCDGEMGLGRCEDRSDLFKLECRRQEKGKRHKAEISIRKGSWFENSKMTLEEILKLTFWWRQDLDQAQIKHELGLAESSSVDWDSFCRDVCDCPPCLVLFKMADKVMSQRYIPHNVTLKK